MRSEAEEANTSIASFDQLSYSPSRKFSILTDCLSVGVQSDFLCVVPVYVTEPYRRTPQVNSSRPIGYKGTLQYRAYSSEYLMPK